MAAAQPTATSCACAVFLPACANFLEAARAALAAPHRADCGLYFNGRQMAWLPRPLPGWFPAPATIALREAA